MFYHKVEYLCDKDSNFDSEMEYKLSHIATITGGVLHGEDYTVSSIATDSRNRVSADALFVALSGDKQDGHNYITELFKRGVKGFMVERLPGDVPLGCGFVVVSDSLRALQDLATYHRSQFKGKVIAITGSNGKTMVKEWFAQLWDSSNGKLFRSPRSYNSQLGVALSLLMIEGDEAYAVIEAGISKPGEMEALKRMIQPTIGVLTNIGDAHLENFESKHHIWEEKMKLFKEDGLVLTGIPTTQNIHQRNADLVISIYTMMELKHKPVEELRQLTMRLELKRGVRNSMILNDSYVNDLASLNIALDYQNRLKKERRVVIFSDYAAWDYLPVAKLISEHKVDLFVGVGENISQQTALFPPSSLFYKTTADCIANFDTTLIENSSVLLKGSRKYAFEHLSDALELKSHTTVLEVDLEAMAENLNHYRAMTAKGCRMMAMVKAHSYGSGSVEVATMLQHQGVDYLAVAFADEGMELRRGGIHAPIVVLNSDPHSFETMIKHDLEPEIYSFSSLNNFITVARRNGMHNYPIHIKLDTGMHRLGFMEHEIDKLSELLQGQDIVKMESVFSHLAAADDESEDEFTLAQIELFKAMAARLPKAMWHICNSSGIARFAQAHFDMVRLGIGLYTGVKPVMTLKTKIVQIKTIPAGDTIGYGRHGKPQQDTPIAIIPIGYADGLNRHLSRGVGSVNINGVLCPIIGNICMDTAMVDISELAGGAKEGDEVVIFGSDPSVEQLAQWLNTISYEVLTSVSSRIRRIYTN